MKHSQNRASKDFDVTDDSNSKNYNLPLQQACKRSKSFQKSVESPKQIIIPQNKTPSKPTNLASRLIQKRQSVERKIEEMRKLKIEAEMKEVQSKPKISAKSRVMAVRAEKKYYEISKTYEKRPQHEVKRFCDDEIIELEEDIQLIEACLNMDRGKAHELRHFKMPLKQNTEYHYNTVDRELNKNQFVKTEESPKRKQVVSNKSSVKPISKVISKETSIGSINNTPQRRFIKKNSKANIKNRSSSVTSLNEINFAYRSLSPYQVSILKKD